MVEPETLDELWQPSDVQNVEALVDLDTEMPLYFASHMFEAET